MHHPRADLHLPLGVVHGQPLHGVSRGMGFPGVAGLQDAQPVLLLLVGLARLALLPWTP